MHEGFSTPAFHLAIALAVGMVAQSLARHLKIPGIVLLLGAGVVLGPDLLGVIRPDVLGDTLQMLVGFAVAVILFEGGLNLRLTRIRREARSIQQLVTVGAAVTAVGGAVAARLFLEWELGAGGPVRRAGDRHRTDRDRPDPQTCAPQAQRGDRARSRGRADRPDRRHRRGSWCSRSSSIQANPDSRRRRSAVAARPRAP